MKQSDVPSRHDFPSEHLCKAVAGIDQFAWPGAEIILNALRHKRDSTGPRASLPFAELGLDRA